jgi:DNA-binding LacI/PurR family transcriptional regulator
LYPPHRLAGATGHQHRRRPPSIVGFDDLDVARLLDPPLTTVAADAEALGAAAFGALLTLLRGEEPENERVVPVELVVRGSTAPPR